MNDIYVTYDNKKLQNNLGFAFFPSLDYFMEDCESEVPQYDEVYNTYKVKIRQKLGFNLNEDSNPLLNYVITVPANWKTNNPPYLRGLTTQGSIDLSLLNSGKSELTGWRFYNDIKTKTTTIAYFFEVYPKPGKSFTNLTITFFDENVEIYTYKSNQEIKYGLTTISFDWNETNFQERMLYDVKLTYLDCDNNEQTEELWLLTTPLFNDCFLSSNKNYIENYCHRKQGEETKIFDEKRKIKLKISNKDSISINSVVEYLSDGSLISSNRNIEYTSIQKDYLFVDSSKINIEIQDENNYPKYISVKDNIKINVELKSTNIDQLYQRIKLPETGTIWGSSQDYLSINSSNPTKGDIEITSIEKVMGVGSKAEDLQNVFVKMSWALPNMLSWTDKYCTLTPDIDMDYDTNFWGGDGKNMRIAFVEKSDNEIGLKDFSNPLENVENNNNEYVENGESLGYMLSYYHDECKHFQVVPSAEDGNSNSIERVILSNDVESAINKYIDDYYNKYPCTWLFSSEDTNLKHYYHDFENNYENYPSIKNKSKSSKDYTILWWKALSEDNETIGWRASKCVVQKNKLKSNNKNDLQNLVKSIFGTDFYFCFIIDSGSSSELGLYVPNKNTKVFNFPRDDFKITLNFNIIKTSSGDNYVNNLELRKSIIKFQESFIDDDDECTIDYLLEHTDHNIEEDLTGISQGGLIDMDKCRTQDYNNNPLSVQNIYIENPTDKKLYPIQNNPFRFSNNEILRNGSRYRYLCCKKENEQYGKITITGSSQNNPACIEYYHDGIPVRIYFRKIPLIPTVSL